MGLAYGACDSAKASAAKRIAYLIGPDGRIVESHAKVDARSYPAEQLKTIP